MVNEQKYSYLISYHYVHITRIQKLAVFLQVIHAVITSILEGLGLMYYAVFYLCW